MMKAKVVKSGLLFKDSQQIKPSYYLNEGKYRIEHAILNGAKHQPLNSVTRGVYSCPIFKRIYVDGDATGYQYITASDMMKTNPVESCKYISKRLTKNPVSMALSANQMLVSCAGTVGNVRLITNDLAGVIGSQDIIRVDADDEVLPYGYVYAYLSSNVVFQYLQSMIYGSVVPRLEDNKLGTLPVIIPDDAEQQAIHTAIETAARLRVEANALLTGAEAQFLANLGLDEDTYRRLTSASERDTAAAFVVSSDALSARTVRARNYGKRLRDIVAALTVGEHDKLVNVLQREPFQTGRFRRIESTSATAVELFSQSDIFALKPKGQSISPLTVPYQDKPVIERGTTIVAGTGTLGENEIFGRAKFVWGYLDNKLVTQDITRIEPDQELIDPGYLFAVLNSKLWFRIFRSSVFGTNLLRFIVPMLNEMPVPRFDKAIEEAIGQQVKTAYEKMTEANQRETEAIARVEALVGSW